MAGRIKSVKNANYPIGNRTSNLANCRAVLQAAAPLPTPRMYLIHLYLCISADFEMCGEMSRLKLRLKNQISIASKQAESLIQRH